MSRLDMVHPPAAVFPVSLLESHTGRRLIVLVPDAESDYTPVVQRVWELANAIGGRVQFLGLCKDAAKEPYLRRQLVTMSALAQNGNLPAEVRIESGADWVAAIKTDLKSSDTIVCFSEQRVGFSRKPLMQVLESNINAPLYVLSGIPFQERSRPDWLKQTLAWSGSIGIIIGFFWIQILIQSATSDWAHTTLLLLSLFLEASLLLFWNSLFG